MDTLNYVVRRLIYSIPTLFGVTLISFILMVYFGPDRTFMLLGKNPTEQQIEEIRAELGYDQPFVQRYLDYVSDLATFDLGYSDSTGEKVTSILARTVPISLLVAIPAFILSNVISVTLALLAAFYRGGWPDRTIMVLAVVGMSTSFLIVVIAGQIVFSSEYGLDWFPVQGWSSDSALEYFQYVTVPTLTTTFVAVGYNTRFFRAVIVEELNRDYVRTARAYGASPTKLLFKHILKNAMVPILTRIMITIPFVIIGGNLVVESYFSIPGVGLTTYDAIVTGDLPIVKAVVAILSIIYIAVLILTDVLYKLIDPRISLS